MDIIPAIDMLDGRCVRLRQGKYDEATFYDAAPVELAQRVAAAGVRRLHVVDLDGARTGRTSIYDTVAAIVRATDLTVDVGGGIASVDDGCRLIDAGAAMVCLGTLAVREPHTVMGMVERCGADRIIVSLDVWKGSIRVRGWEEDGNIGLYDAMDVFYPGATCRFMITDIASDGMKNGPATDLYEQAVLRYPDAAIIASGGVRNRADLRALAAAGCSGVVIGRAWLDGDLDLTELAGGEAPW